MGGGEPYLPILVVSILHELDIRLRPHIIDMHLCGILVVCELVIDADLDGLSEHCGLLGLIHGDGRLKTESMLQIGILLLEIHLLDQELHRGFRIGDSLESIGR